MDFNPYSAVTDALLFSWEELKFGPAKLSKSLHICYVLLCQIVTLIPFVVKRLCLLCNMYM